VVANGRTESFIAQDAFLGTIKATVDSTDFKLQRLSKTGFKVSSQRSSFCTMGAAFSFSFRLGWDLNPWLKIEFSPLLFFFIFPIF
jgi:hypothetical protein